MCNWQQQIFDFQSKIVGPRALLMIFETLKGLGPKLLVKDKNFYTAMRNLVLHSDPKIPIDSDDNSCFIS